MASYYRLQNYYKHRPMAMAKSSSYNPFKRYVHNKEDESERGKVFMQERAPSTAEIMKGMEEEQERESQTLEKNEKTRIETQTLDESTHGGADQQDSDRRQAADNEE